jgi:hypothetical protein
MSKKYLGVTYHKGYGRYEAHIWLTKANLAELGDDVGHIQRRDSFGKARRGLQLFLGSFDRMEDAAVAYDISSICLRGDKAQTNFDVSTYDTKTILSIPFLQLVQDTTWKKTSSLEEHTAGTETPSPPALPAQPAHKTINEMIAEQEQANYEEFIKQRKILRARRFLQQYYIDNFIMTDRDGRPYFRQ